MRQKLVMLFFFASITSSILAQQTRVSFKVVNNKSEGLPFVTVSVVSVPDTINKVERITDSTGFAYFSLIAGRPYKIIVSAVEFVPVVKAITVKGDNPVYTIVVETLSTSLGTVVVNSRRPIMRQEDDKTIVDPENLAASSTNAYEMMEKVPGLFVDQDGNIYLNSMTPATVHINGREQKMSTADVATMLKSLPPNSIASIEILRTPSAKYDASGGGGIVNVVLKKGVRIGLTGSVNAGFNQGRVGNRFAGINLNNNNGKVGSYVNLQWSQRNNRELLNSNRTFALDSLLNQQSKTFYPVNSYFIGYGINWEVNKRCNINYDGRININQSNNNSTNLSQIKQISTGNVVESNNVAVDNDGRNRNFSQSISGKYKIDSLGSEWSTDLSFNYAPNNTTQTFNSIFYEPVMGVNTSRGNIENTLHFFSAQTNLVKKFTRKLTLETGLKSTNVWFKNTTVYNKIAAYEYNENINAAYLQASKGIGSFILKTGTRLENTNMKGVQIAPGDTSFSLKRTDLFPYVYLSRNLFKIAGYDLRAYLVYRRTINRPAYEYLNPAERRVDPYLFETGNPSLRPQFTQNYEANVSFEERPVFAIGVNDTKDIFTNVIYQADSSSKVAYRTYDNLGKTKETYFRALGALPPGKRYFFVAGTQYNHNFYQGFYEGKPLSYKRGSWSFFTYQTFRLTPLTNITLNGFVRFNGIQQFYELSTFGALNTSITQQLFKKKLTLTLSATDLFFTNNNDFVLQQGTVDAYGFRQSDTRRFGLNLRYNLGFRKKEENNLFNIDSPEKVN